MPSGLASLNSSHLKQKKGLLPHTLFSSLPAQNPRLPAHLLLFFWSSQLHAWISTKLPVPAFLSTSLAPLQEGLWQGNKLRPYLTIC